MYSQLKEGQSKVKKTSIISVNEDILPSYAKQKSLLPSIQHQDLVNTQPRMSTRLTHSKPIQKLSSTCTKESKKLSPLFKLSQENNDDHPIRLKRNFEVIKKNSLSIEHPYYDIRNRSPNINIKKSHNPARFYPVSQLKPQTKKPLLHKKITDFGPELSRVLVNKNANQASLTDSSPTEPVFQESSSVLEDGYSLYSLN